MIFTIKKHFVFDKIVSIMNMKAINNPKTKYGKFKSI